MLDFREVNAGDAELTLSWRVKKRISRFMNTDISNDIDAQAHWLDSCCHKPSYYPWIIAKEDRPIGFIYIHDFNRDNKTTAWGFYIGEDDCLGMGSFVPLYFYNFCFRQLGLREIHAEIFYDNTRVIQLHQLHGYKFYPSKDRVIDKNGRDVLLVAMELNAENFNYSKYKKFTAEFPLNSWSARPQLISNVSF